MRSISLTLLILGCLAICAALIQQIGGTVSTDATDAMNVGISNIHAMATPPGASESPKLPAQMPEAVEFHYMRHNGQMPMTMIDIKNGVVAYEHRDYTTSQPVRRSRKISRGEMKALYRVFIDNKFDRIQNDPAVEQANDTANERIGIAFAAGAYIQIVSDPIVSPLSGDSLKRFEAVKEAMFKLLDLEAEK